MKYFMFWILGTKQDDDSYRYVSNFQETEEPSPQSRTFASEAEMRDVMDAIYATQNKPCDFDQVIGVIQNGGHHWFGTQEPEPDLHLT
jgi:hypothetical protein